MSVADAVTRDLKRLPAELAESAPAATMLAMADRLDNGGGSPSECAKALLDAWTKLRDLAPPEREKNDLDDLSSRRAKRLTRASRAAN